MRRDDWERFVSLLGKLERVFGKALDEDTMRTWWRALQDLPIELVEQRIDAHIKHSKFFPKPFELRPKEDRPKERDVGEERKFQALVQQSIKNWDERLREGPRAKFLLLQAYAARIDVQHPRDSIEYAEKMRFARQVYQELRPRLADAEIAADLNLLKTVGTFDSREFKRLCDVASELRCQKVAA